MKERNNEKGKIKINRILYSRFYILDSGRRGFTLIELMIVLAISAFLTTIVIAYSNVSQNSVSLSVEETTIAQEIAHARTLAISTYASSSNATVGNYHACGFGVEFDYVHNKYSLVAYAPAAAQSAPVGNGACPTLGTPNNVEQSVTSTDLIQYGNDAWQMPLVAGVALSTTTANPMTLVLFYPPDPTVLLSQQVCGFGNSGCAYPFLSQPGSVPLVTADGGSSSTIKVGIVGEIDW